MDGGIGGVEGYVGSVERGVFVDVAGVGWVLYNDLLGKWRLFGDVVNEFGEGVSQLVVAADSVWAVLAVLGDVQVGVDRLVAVIVGGGSLAVGWLRGEWFVES